MLMLILSKGDNRIDISFLKEFRVSIRVYAVERLKALALDSELIQILASLNLEYQSYLN